MTPRYLLDTNIISDLARHPQGRVAVKIAELDEGVVATSIIVAAELRYGVAKKGAVRLATQIEAILGALEVISFEPPADVAYGLARAELQRLGTPIGANDLFIAAHAISLNLILVTNNEREFTRVPRLQTENWLR